MLNWKIQRKKLPTTMTACFRKVQLDASDACQFFRFFLTSEDKCKILPKHLYITQTHWSEKSNQTPYCVKARSCFVIADIILPPYFIPIKETKD